MMFIHFIYLLQHVQPIQAQTLSVVSCGYMNRSRTVPEVCVQEQFMNFKFMNGS